MSEIKTKAPDHDIDSFLLSIEPGKKRLIKKPVDQFYVCTVTNA